MTSHKNVALGFSRKMQIKHFCVLTTRVRHLVGERKERKHHVLMKRNFLTKSFILQSGKIENRRTFLHLIIRAQASIFLKLFSLLSSIYFSWIFWWLHSLKIRALANDNQSACYNKVSVLAVLTSKQGSWRVFFAFIMQEDLGLEAAANHVIKWDQKRNKKQK